MNLKKYIKPAGMFVGSLVVINVGIYFLLQATTPKIGPRAGEGELAADSLHSDSLLTQVAADSLLAESATAISPQADLTVVQNETTPPIEEANLAEAMASLGGEEPVSGATEEPSAEMESASDAPQQDAETAAQAIKEGDSKEIAKLAKYLEAMKPRDAAAIATELDTDEIIALMMRMKDRTAGKILAELPVDQAARIATQMSQTASRARSGS